MRFPPLLAAGSRVALVSPSGPFRDAAELEAARLNVERFGWVPIAMANVAGHDGYLAGSDEQRLADLNAAIADPSIDAIWCLRGGYGAMRLLEFVDYESLRRRPKALIGYSDATALHSACGRFSDLVTFHGPTARQTIPLFSERSLLDAVVRGDDPCGPMPAATTLRGGRVTGRLVGGNLALLASLTGTPYAPDYTGAILAVEDVNEAHYRTDRMLTQLRLSGSLRGLAGIIFGQFTGIPDEYGQDVWTLQRVLGDFANRLDVPCVSGAPFGHLDEQWTLPLGANAEFDADAKTLTILRT